MITTKAATLMLTILSELNELMRKYDKVDWFWGIRRRSGPDPRITPPNEEIREALLQYIWQSHCGGGSGRVVEFQWACLLCEFQEFGRESPNPFWADLWQCLEKHGINAVPIQERIRNTHTRYPDCSAYMGEHIVKEIAEQLDAS